MRENITIIKRLIIGPELKNNDPFKKSVIAIVEENMYKPTNKEYIPCAGYFEFLSFILKKHHNNSSFYA
tara:strand:- start:305 stop:511 length:207 start_codon:yes stop_codon:yes gene_type:complete